MLRKLILTLLIVQVCTTLFAQKRKLEYSHKLSISEGLAHNGVTCILKDSRGYIWISTYDGLNRYDGYECKIYKNTLEHNFFVSNRIRTIAEDKQGNLWLGTDEGISIYNYAEEQYTTIYANKNAGKGDNGPIVRKILMNEKHGVVVCATEGYGILVFNEDRSLSKQIVPPANISTENVIFQDGIELDEENYLFSTSLGILHFNLANEQFYRPFPNEVFNGKGIIKLAENKILATRTYGINVYTYEKEANGKYAYKLLFEDFITRQFNSATVDKVGALWLGNAQQGVMHIDDVEAFINKKPYTTFYFSSSSGFLRTSCFLATENNGCWVGTFNKGLFQFDLKENPFKVFNSEMNDNLGLRTNEILHTVPIDKDKLFISSNTGGSVVFNTKTEEYEGLPFDAQTNNQLNTNVFCVDSKKNIWIRSGIRNRILRSENANKTVETLKCDSLPNLEQIVPRSIVEDKEGNIWMGCLDDVYKLTLNNKSEIINAEALNNHPLFKNNKFTLVRKVYVDPLYNYIWVGTDSDGLIRIENDENKSLVETEVEQYLPNDNDKLAISSNFVSAIIRLPNSELWIGTERGGIVKVVNSNANPEFVAYSEKNGLSNNVVKNILYDDEYNLWISTNIGLNKFDTKDFHFRTFGKQDGLPFEDFLYPAAKLDNGYLLFAGADGFFFFDPNTIKNEEVLPMLKFGDLTLFNKVILPGDVVNKRVLYTTRLSDNDELVLKHDENVFSIELSSLHYSTPNNHFLKYKLSPLNNEWIEVTSEQRLIAYNGLQPGDYKLEVMGSNSLNEWTSPISLAITIKPPFWLTTPAYILYVITILLIVYSIMYYILRMNKLKHNLEIEQLEKDKVKEVNAAKLRFFSDISHEIKTPLTLISGPVNLLAERFKSNQDAQEKLQIVQRQSKKMLRLVNQVHDFQRADANQLKMNYSHFCFNYLVAELIDDFRFKASNDKKILKVDEPSGKIIVSADRDKLEKILNNLLNNAFKFTRKGDTITVDYKNLNNELIIKVSDTGKGIEVEDLPHIFERFYQSKKKHSEYTGGSGIGLAFAKRLVEMHYGYIEAESLLHKGSTFSVKLPVITSENQEVSHKNEAEILEVEKKFDSDDLLTERIEPEDIRVEGEFENAIVFFAEDNTDMRTFISGILSNFFKVRSFVNGNECLIALEEEWPDIVVSDVLMPEMNGFDLCKNIKSDIKTSHIPVVLLTACSSIEEQLTGLEVGADSYIKKPFHVQHLVTRIETLLQNRKKLRERYQLDFPLVLEKKQDNNNDIAFLEKLYALMEESLDNQNLDLDRFAKQLYLNRTHFYQKVKALTNHTPFELLKSYRLKKAAELLAKQKLAVNEVYMLTGFKSRTHFSKLFKEAYGVTPGKYVDEIVK